MSHFKRIFPRFFLVWFISFCFGTICGNAQSTLPDSLIEQVHHAKNGIEKYSSLAKISRFHYLNGNYEEEGAILKELLVIAQDLKNDTLLMQVYSKLGWFFELRSDFNLALDYSFNALHIAERLQSNRDIILLNNTISIIYYDLQNHTEAIRYLRKVMFFSSLDPEKLEREAWLNTVYTNLCGNYYDLGELDSALKYANLAHEGSRSQAASRDKNSIQLGFMTTFAQIYEKLGDYNLAEAYHQKTLLIADSLGLLPYESDTYRAYGTFLLNRQRIPEATANVIIGLRAAQESNYRLGIIEASKILGRIYSKLSHTDSAYYYANLELRLRDTVYDEQKMNQLYSRTLAEQVRQKEQAFSLSEQKKQANRNIQYLAIAVGVITFIILFFLLSQSIIVSSGAIKVFGVIALLITFEFINLLIHPFITRVTHHSPVLILLAMVCVAAIIVPFHHNLEKWMITRLQEKNKKIRLAAAKKTIAELEEPIDQAVT